MGTITTQIGNPSKGHAYKIIEYESEDTASDKEGIYRG
jgi:hypothetical protein